MKIHGPEDFMNINLYHGGVSLGSVMMSDAEHERQQRARNEHQQFAPAEPWRIPRRQLGQNMYSRHIKECTGTKQHRNAGSVEVCERFLAFLKEKISLHFSDFMILCFAILTWLRLKYVMSARRGAAAENIIKCLRIRVRSRPSCIKNETRPNAAGAYKTYD